MEEKKDFDELFRHYYQELYFFAMQFLHNDDESRDVVSDAFEDVWVNFSSLQKKAARYYLYKSVRNKCIDVLRRNTTRQQYALFYQKITKAYAYDKDPLEAEDRERRVQQVLDMLEQPTKDVFISCYVEQQTYAEAAARFGISTATVKKRIMKALNLIREARRKTGEE